MKPIVPFLLFIVLTGCVGAQDGEEVRLVEHQQFVPIPDIEADVDVPTRVLVTGILDSLGRVTDAAVLEGVRPDLDSLALVAFRGHSFPPSTHFLGGGLPARRKASIRIRHSVRFVPRR